MNSKRPVNLDLRTIQLPITAYTSIAHRISGVILFLAIALMLWMLELSLGSEAGFEQVKTLMQNPLVKFITWGVVSALLYHLVAGIRHLVMDAGIGEGLESGKLGSKIVIAVSVVLIVLLGVWIW
ncbi:succinate dehydrogenase, cytochrome b556 subunit [Halopseudomonas yangmingensis]|uniref:succinate dehydrogenase, cytochrome b556 subunit n=1 Tax=Halopseudomonas yangmingensis TaxID=1720063 RepID=UPI000B84E3AC|nr:succinate dehydrogenase, cytochrome b556 subunit [Halopseudomonas yangmingensis]